MLTTRASPQRGATQVLRVIVTTEGIAFRCEDEGKVCQSSVYFPGGFFATFSAPPARSTFSVHLPTLLDALRVFAALPSVTVRATQCVLKAKLASLQLARPLFSSRSRAGARDA